MAILGSGLEIAGPQVFKDHSPQARLPCKLQQVLMSFGKKLRASSSIFKEVYEG